MKFHKRVIEGILKDLEEGMLEDDVGPANGISKRTYYYWKAGDEGLRDKIEVAIIKYKKKLITIVNVGSLNKPMVALEMLARRWPEEWSAKLKVEQMGKIEHYVTYEEALRIIWGEKKDDNTTNRQSQESQK